MNDVSPVVLLLLLLGVEAARVVLLHADHLPARVGRGEGGEAAGFDRQGRCLYWYLLTLGNVLGMGGIVLRLWQTGLACLLWFDGLGLTSG